MNRERKHVRLRNFDYSSEGAYFITMVIKNRQRLLGKIVNQVIELSEAGKIADEKLNKIPEYFPHAELNEYSILPDHIHCILFLFEVQEEEEKESSTFEGKNPCRKPDELPRMEPIKTNSGETNQFGKHKKGSISLIIQQFKAGVSRSAHNNGIPFEWQGKFHDHVIRNEKEYQRIKAYIQNNAKNWKD